MMDRPGLWSPQANGTIDNGYPGTGRGYTKPALTWI
jgi:hypothetical protein